MILHMLTPIHVLLTVHLRKSALVLVESPECPEQIRVATFKLMAFFFPKVDVFRNVDDEDANESQNPRETPNRSQSPSAVSESDNNPSDENASSAVKDVSDSCTEIVASAASAPVLPEELQAAVELGLKVCSCDICVAAVAHHFDTFSFAWVGFATRLASIPIARITMDVIERRNARKN